MLSKKEECAKMTRQRAFLFVQAMICTLVAGLLAYSAVNLYLTGAAEQAGGDLFYYIYTREKVGERLAPILPLIFLGLGMMLSGIILGIRDESADKPVQDPELMRDLICARVQNPSEAMTAERTIQRRLRYGGWIGFTACMVPVAIYIANPAHFDRPLDTEADLLALMKVFVPFTVLGLGCLAVTAMLGQNSMRRETEAAKSQPAGGSPATIPISVRSVGQNDSRGALILRVVVAALAVAMIVIGIRNGGMEDVLTKANAICMECVGLG